MKFDRFEIRYDRIIETVVLLLMAIGTVFVFSAGATVSGEYDLSRFYAFTTLKQLIFFPAAVGLMYLVSAIDYRKFSITQRPPGYSLMPYLLLLVLGLLIFVLFWGVERNYSRRWMDLAPGPVYISFQPSELAKWVIIIFIAAYIERYQDYMKEFWRGFVPVCLISGLFIGLIVIEDFGTAAFIGMMTFLMLLIGGTRLLYLFTTGLLSIPCLIAAVMMSPTRINRIKDYLDPMAMSYQAKQSLIAISSGGLFGKGLGRGVLKYGHLPEDTTDFIFSIIAEEMGFAACIFVIILFVIFTWAGIRVVLRCRDCLGRMIAGGIVMAIALQAAINIGVVTVVLPTKGIPLPFISAGGTSMLLTAAAVGVLLNIARHGSEIDHEELLIPNIQNRFASESVDG